MFQSSRKNKNKTVWSLPLKTWKQCAMEKIICILGNGRLLQLEGVPFKSLNEAETFSKRLESEQQLKVNFTAFLCQTIKGFLDEGSNQQSMTSAPAPKKNSRTV